MTYQYKCEHCKIQTDITKPVAEVERIEHCQICESELKRVYEAVSIKTTDGVKK